MLDKGMIHVPGRMEQDIMKFHQAARSGMQFKMYGLFVSGIFHFIFSNHS
jgi:hypothetical protein